MPTTINGQTYYRTAEVCRMAGISRNTLFRWLREGLFTSVERRDYRGWRLFTQGQVDAINDRVTRVVTVTLGADNRATEMDDRSADNSFVSQPIPWGECADE